MSTTTAHTPGPWFVDSSDWPIIVNGPEGNAFDVIASVPLPGSDLGTVTEQQEYQAHANARLIAKAPELLAYVAEIARCGYLVNRDHVEDITDKARKLLAEIDG